MYRISAHNCLDPYSPVNLWKITTSIFFRHVYKFCYKSKNIKDDKVTKSYIGDQVVYR